MPDTSQTEATVTITVDGKEMEAKAGELLIAAAERGGVYIPRFCWHNRMRPVAMCRMCLVEVEGMRGLQPSCYVPVKDGMVAHTQTDASLKAQEGVLEFLLINHPLDCPVCDRGGDCPLQDHTMAFGPGESRFVEEKRHFEKPIPISDLVLLDRERCIQCSRCTRFAQEVAGDPLIDFGMRGNDLHIITFPDDPFASYFSGNTVQVCPVGALTAVPYRFKARPWDMTLAETTCQTCAVGCRGILHETRNKLVRMLGADVDPVNWGWLCDKGRFGYEYVASPERLTQPRRRSRAGGFEDITWAEAIEDVARKVEPARGRMAAIGGARLTNEEAYALSKFVRLVGGTNDLDCQLGDGLPGAFVAGLTNRATISDCDTAAAIVIAGPDLKEELPVLYLRVRDAVVNRHVPLFVAGGHQSGLEEFARHVGGLGSVQVPQGEGHVVLIAGRRSLTQDGEAVAAAAIEFSGRLGDRVRILPALRRSNVNGAIDMGVSPELLPGRVAVDDPDARARFARYWSGSFPTEPGRDTRGILQAAADGDVDVLLLAGADPLNDFPDPGLARRALERCPYVVVSDLFHTDVADLADVVVPAAGWAEIDGTVTNIEGRVSRVAAKVVPPGQSASDSNLFREIAERVGVEFGCGTWEATLHEISHVARAYSGVRPSTFRGAKGKDGVLAAPGTIRYEPPATPAGAPASRAGGPLALEVGRMLYDGGTLNSHCPSLADLGPGAVVRIDPVEAGRAGVADGDAVTLRAEAAAEAGWSADLTVRVDPVVEPGVAFVPHRQGAPAPPVPLTPGVLVKLEKR